MALIDDLLLEIRNQLSQAAQLNLNRRSAACDVFEAYVFSIVLDAAIREGARQLFQLEDTRGSVSNQAVFRTGPGRIFSPPPPQAPSPYTHAVIQFPDKPAVEVHQGIYVSGKPGLLHECDAAIVLRSEGQTCRMNRVHPRCANVIFASHGKFYGAGLGVGLARGFLGLTTDIWRQGRFFVSNSSSESSQRVLTHHDRKWAEGLVPRNANITNRFRALVERVFEEFKASK